jgi:hypothetical protein
MDPIDLSIKFEFFHLNFHTVKISEIEKMNVIRPRKIEPYGIPDRTVGIFFSCQQPGLRICILIGKVSDGGKLFWMNRRWALTRCCAISAFTLGAASREKKELPEFFREAPAFS